MSNTHRDSEADRVNLALSAAEMGTWDLDVSAAVIWWDDRMHSLFGLAPGAFYGKLRGFSWLCCTKRTGKGFAANLPARRRHAPPWTQSFG